MARIYKRSDRIPVKIDDITIQLAPLTIDQKTEIEAAMRAGRRGDLFEGTKGVKLSMKYSIKSIEGVEDVDGNPYQLEFDSNGDLADACIDDLLNLGMTHKLMMVCSSLANGIPSNFTDENGEKLEGVEIVKRAKSEPVEKNS